MTASDEDEIAATAAMQVTSVPYPMRLITKAELRAIVPYSPQHILRLEKRGLFPRRVQVGANRVGWLLTEIEEWVTARIAERDASARLAAERRMQRSVGRR